MVLARFQATLFLGPFLSLFHGGFIFETKLERVIPTFFTTTVVLTIAFTRCLYVSLHFLGELILNSICQTYGVYDLITTEGDLLIHSHMAFIIIILIRVVQLENQLF